jgi:hypothetical protein
VAVTALAWPLACVVLALLARDVALRWLARPGAAPAADPRVPVLEQDAAALAARVQACERLLREAGYST